MLINEKKSLQNYKQLFYKDLLYFQFVILNKMKFVLYLIII